MSVGLSGIKWTFDCQWNNQRSSSACYDQYLLSSQSSEKLDKKQQVASPVNFMYLSKEKIGTVMYNPFLHMLHLESAFVYLGSKFFLQVQTSSESPSYHQSLPRVCGLWQLIHQGKLIRTQQGNATVCERQRSHKNISSTRFYSNFYVLFNLFSISLYLKMYRYQH